MEQYIPRQLTEKIKKILNHFPCVVLIGARQVGKSTLLKEIFPDFHYTLFDPVEDVAGARQDPDFFLDNYPTPLILDEIQFAPELVSAIKRRIDGNRKPGQYILTGSQQWGVMKKLSESLAGRAVILELEPFSLAEIANNPPKKPWLERWLENSEGFPFLEEELLNLPYPPLEQIWRGFFPEAQPLPKEFVKDFHSSYQRTYVERDVRLIAEVSDLQLFTRFVRLVAALTAQEINHNQIGRELDIDRSTAKRWLNILKETFEWHEIPAFSSNATKRVSSKSKGYFADTGQVCFSQAVATPNQLASHPLWGAIFENAVVNEIRKQTLLMATAPNLYHFRAYSGTEVDLILEYDGRYFPIEIKAKSHPTSKDTSGIAAFRNHYSHLNIARGLLVCLANKAYPITRDVLAIPWNLR